MFEVVEHAFLENKPPLVLGLVLASFLGQPPLPLRVEERLCEIPVSVRNFELFFPHILKQLLERGEGESERVGERGEGESERVGSYTTC